MATVCLCLLPLSHDSHLVSLTYRWKNPGHPEATSRRGHMETKQREGGGEKERREGGESKKEGGGDWRREGEEKERK